MVRDLEALLADLGSNPLQALAVHWLSLFHSFGRIPQRSEIDPLQFPSLLRYVWLFSAEADGDFRVRLCGEAFSDWYGFNPKGKTFKEICLPAVLPILQSFARQVVDTPCVVLHQAESIMPDWLEPAGFTRIGFPIADSSGAIRYLAGATKFDKHYFNGKGASASEIKRESIYLIPQGGAAKP